jgi:hypothetical protein
MAGFLLLLKPVSVPRYSKVQGEAVQSTAQSEIENSRKTVSIKAVKAIGHLVSD